jgi:ParB family transcriptional regulator, chromosome partitioning protein
MPDNGSIDEVQVVPLEEIDLFVNQSREDFDEGELKQLADNITINGLLQPGVGWLDPGRNRIVLICGERRFRALKLAGKTSMPLKILRGHLTPGQMLQINLAENIKRCSLNPIERGRAFKRLMQLEDLTATEVAARMTVSNATVHRDISLLDLPEALQAKVVSGELPATVGSHIARVEDDETRRGLADQYANGVLNRPGLVAAVNGKLNKGKSKPARLAIKLGGVSICLSGPADKLTLDSIHSVLGRMSREAKSLKDNGKKEITDLVQVLKAS